MSHSKSVSMLDAGILVPAIGGAFRKLDPRSLARNPVMFVVAVVSVLTTVLFVRDLVTGAENLGFAFQNDVQRIAEIALQHSLCIDNELNQRGLV